MGLSQYGDRLLVRLIAACTCREMTGNGGPVLASPSRNDFGGRGPSGGGGRGGPAGFSGRGAGGRQDRIVGKSITIAKGPYRCAPRKVPQNLQVFG